MSLVVKTDQIIRRPTHDDIEFVIQNIRDEDVEEINAMSGENVHDILMSTANIKDNSWVWERCGTVHAIFGVNPVPDKKGVGVVWMLATKSFDEHFMTFASASRSVFKSVVEGYDYIFNYVYEKNIKSIKWLVWLGFTVRDAEKIGVNGAKFHRFEMVVEHV